MELMTFYNLEKTKRNKKLYQLYRQGVSYGQLAKIFHISRARAYQIVKAQQKKELKVEESKKGNKDERGN
jgi:Mor family transcriptional regulator